MKVWPIITLVGLIYGSTLADPKGVGRESNPHPHRSSLDAEVAADFAQPHRPVTMAFREVFAKLLNEETDWSAPDGKATAQAEADADDGQDPGKKLFWSTNHPDMTGVPFPGWGDPNAEPDHPLVSPPACSSCRPDLEIFYYIIDDPAPPKEDENMATTAALHSLQLPFGALKILDNMVIGSDGKVTVMPCETILVNGACPLPCKPNDPLCVDDPIVVDPTDPTSPVTPPVIIIGGGGGGSGPVGAISGVPETSTWLMGTHWLWFFELVQAFRDVHGVGPYPPPDESLSERGRAPSNAAGGGGPACLFSRTVLYGCGTDSR